MVEADHVFFVDVVGIAGFDPVAHDCFLPSIIVPRSSSLIRAASAAHEARCAIPRGRAWRWRQFALQEIVLVAQLAQEGRDHLAVAVQDRRVRRRQVVLDHLMQPGQRVIRHHREHVVLDVVVHVPVDEAADRVHEHGAAVEPVVGDVVGKPAMLQQPGHAHGARRRRGAAGRSASAAGSTPWRSPARSSRHRSPSRCGRRGSPSGCSISGMKVFSSALMLPNALRTMSLIACQASRMPKKLSTTRSEVRRPHDGDFGIAADDDRVGVVARMAPAPGDRIAHDHEAGDLIDRHRSSSAS